MEYNVNLFRGSRIYEAGPEESEVGRMCPEPDFGLCYHSLLEYYRPSPEGSRSQLSAILARFFTRNEGEDPGSRKNREKGGVCT